MAKEQEEITLGSQRLLQLAVNQKPELLRSALRKSGALGRREAINWTSPLESENFKEYRDQAALARVGVEMPSFPLHDFWPRREPVWDATAITSLSRPIFLEAKAHIPESASPGTKASPKSLQKIEQSLRRTRKHLAPRAKSLWTGIFYQYANRLAHQYYLRVLNDINSSLVFLEFTNAADMDGPATEQEWQGATRLIHAVLGLPADLTSFGVFHAYIDARHLTDAS